MTTTDNKIQFLYFTTVWLKSKQFSAYKEHSSQVLSFEFVLSVVLKYDVCKTILNQQIVLATLYISTDQRFNNLKSEKTSSQIAKLIIDLALKLETDSNKQIRLEVGRH